MAFGDFDAVAHDGNHFGNVPNQIVIIRSETVAKAVLNPNAKFKADFFLRVLVVFCGVERFVWEFGFNVIQPNPKRLGVFQNKSPFPSARLRAAKCLATSRCVMTTSTPSPIFWTRVPACGLNRKHTTG